MKKPEEALEPLRNLLLVEKDEPSDAEGTYGLIVAPSTARPDPHCRGTVLRGGPLTTITAGQRVCWGYHSGTELGLSGEDRELVLLAEEEVLFIEMGVPVAAP